MTERIVVCKSCVGRGGKISQVASGWVECRACGGSGEVAPCNNFNSDKPSVFRNRPCTHCNATEDQHVIEKVSV